MSVRAPQIPLATFFHSTYNTAADIADVRADGGPSVARQCLHALKDGGVRMFASGKTTLPWLLLVGSLIGCGQSAAPETAANTAENGASATVSPEADPAPSSSELESPSTLASTEAAAPVEGSPAWNLQEIVRIRLLPLPALDLPEEADDAPNGVQQVEATAPAQPTMKERLAQTREIRKTRNQEIVGLAMDTIAKTAKDPSQETALLTAVHHLLDAQLQLALQGDEDSTAALYEAAEAFYAKMPKSPAAAEAQLTLVNLAHANALRYAKTEPRWLQEFSRHAQLLATRFPSEAAHALPLLLAAGRSCELNGFVDEAKSCFNLISSKYPESPQAVQVAGILRRMNLVGQPVEFEGPTLDGNYLNIKDFQGTTVVVVFWATHASPFVEQVPQLQKLTDTYRKYIKVLSVSLDSEEGPIDTFLEQSRLTWPVIYHVEQDKRGWNAPLASYYGVTTLPTIWVIDPTGKVAATDVTAETLEATLREVILKHRNSTPAPGVDKNAGESPNRS